MCLSWTAALISVARTGLHLVWGDWGEGSPVAIPLRPGARKFAGDFAAGRVATADRGHRP